MATEFTYALHHSSLHDSYLRLIVVKMTLPRPSQNLSMPTKQKIGRKPLVAQMSEEMQQYLLANAPDEFFIRHLPMTASIVHFPDDLPNLYRPVTQHGWLAIKLRGLQKDYRRTKNGIYLLKAFLMTHGMGFYPPMWALTALFEGVRNYMSDPLSKPLDSCLSLKGGPGQEPGSKAAIRRERDRSIAHDMFILHTRFGLTIEEAAEVEATKIVNKPVLTSNRSGIVGSYKVGTLAKWYPEWAKEFGLNDGYYQEVSPHWGKKVLQSFLEGFSTDDLHEDTKLKLKIRPLSQTPHKSRY